ncbi:MAG TPA: hypothetical protein DHV05_02880, partial [Acholeplasmataceae bacterium]|nr:hypothetical protein [Acholeplasmataceae bacterium]
MKKKDIKSLIKQEIESHIPKKPVTIDWSYVERERVLEQIEYKQKPVRFRHFRLSLSLALSLLFGIGVWWMVSNFSETPPGIVPTGQTIFEQEQEVLPLSFLSTAALLPAQTNLDVSHVMLIAETTTLTDPLKPFLGMIEMIISQSQGPMVQVIPSDLAEYETLVEIKTFDLLGQPITYLMYYNVISYEEDGDEFTFEIEGLMKNDHMIYPMTGQKEIEDGEEKLTVKGILSEDAYIETTYEFEDDEMKYVIRRVENGTLVYESKLKFEQSGDEIKVELEIESETELSKYELKYELD